ncbi:MAG: hypothetical protein V3T21_03690 [Candidatus Margulisiibacteriota bacterium]
MTILTQKAAFIKSKLQDLPSIRLVSNGINVGRTKVLCRNAIKGKTVKDQAVQAARDYAVERLYHFTQIGMDLTKLSGKELSISREEETTEVTSLKKNRFSRAHYEFNYWVQNYTRRVNAVTALFSYGGAALIKQFIPMDEGAQQGINWMFVGGTALLGSYYSQEVYALYSWVHDKIKADTFKGKIKRVLVTNFIFNPIIFNPRHVAIERFLAGASFLGLGGTFMRGAKMWAGALIPITIIDYIINNKVPKKYKFLAIEAVNLAWATYAAIVSLLN